MATETYFEAAQKVLFQASRDMRKIAGSVLDDVQNDAEFLGLTEDWARGKARFYAEMANELERKAWTVGPYRVNAANTRSHKNYSDAIDRYIARLHAARERAAQTEREALAEA